MVEKEIELNNLRVVLILIILEYIYITSVKNNSKRVASLNPYYTGIHLHNPK